MYIYTFKVNKKLFPSEALLKAAYSFLDSVYIHFEEDDSSWHVKMEPKGQAELPGEIGKRFENELLAQTVRINVANRTKTIREIVLARAMTSTMISNEDPIEKIQAEQADISDEDLDAILTDWFDRYG